VIFASPWLLIALAALPLLWWLLRATPPAPREQDFPAIRLLLGLRATEETPARTPWWLLALRLFAAALVVVGLAGPILDPGAALPGAGPILLVIDDGWAAAADWPARMAAADSVLDRAGRAGRQVALLTLAPSEAAAPPTIQPAMPVADLRPRLAALRPKPWPANRAAASDALHAWNGPEDSVVYLPDGLSTPVSTRDLPGHAEMPTTDADVALADALGRIGPVTEIRADSASAQLLRPPRAEAERLVATINQAPRAQATDGAVLAQTGDGRTLARAPFHIDAEETAGEAAITLPPELRNSIARLVLEGPPSAGGTVLLDERWRRHPVGLLAGDGAGADTPLAGALYFVRAALAPSAELREGSLAQLLGRDISVIILADRPVTDPEEQRLLTDWVRRGGVLLRFAGPLMAETELMGAAEDGAPDPLLPVRLLAGDRQLGGALSWSQPAGLARFAATSPFAGLAVPAEVRVTRQVLAEPSADLPSHSWASLADGTPLVTAAELGAGRVVLFHVTANGAWSNLPISGLFVDMLKRLVDLSVGVASAPSGAVLAPSLVLDGFGQAANPGPAASALVAARLPITFAAPEHPPGLYGPEAGRVAINLSAGLGMPAAGDPVPGSVVVGLAATSRQLAPGPFLLAGALGLLILDLVLSLWLRGLLRGGARAAAAMLLLGVLAGQPADAAEEPPMISTRIAYIRSGDAALDQVTRAGLTGLAEYVNRRTAANIGAPAPVTPGQDDLSFYPIIVWALSPGTPRLTASGAAALNDYMGHGGIILIDTRGADEVLPVVSKGLLIPPLARLGTDHVLARSFYLLDSFPGRTVGAPVWVARDADRSNDGVSPVVIGANDWAAAWAVDGAGRAMATDLPGGARQRTLAYRFGVNLMMYALTGNYKGDQVHVPALLERLGQ